MSEPTPIVVPRENVNDETATLVAWAVADGARVEPGQVVAQIETSKAVVDVVAPSGGVLRHAVAAGQEVAIGGRIGSIAAGGDAVAAPATAGAPKAVSGNGVAASPALAPSVRRIVAESGIDPSHVRGTGRGGRLTKADVMAHLADPAPVGPEGAPRPARFSTSARELVRQLGLDERLFEGQGLVRSRDVLAATAEGGPSRAVAAPTAPAAPPVPIAAAGVATRAERLPRAKRTEAKYLRSGRDTTLASAVTITCPTRGFREAAGRHPAVAGNPTAVIVSEAARLLRKYPAFNAFHADGEVRYYEQVNVGFAVDAGRGLKVPVVRDADRKTIAEVADEMRELVVAYLEDRLPVGALAGGTFTLTDLSGEGVSAFHPLINQGQSAILGVCAETPSAGGAGAFNLVLAFDHQLAEGRTAARFLNDLRERLASYEAAVPRAGDSSAEEPRCARCRAGFSDLAGRGLHLVQTIAADGSTRPLCKLCFEGWT
jgi:pyruvate/2-oxoglutarate dehydrogenase complex dihydrolipoamide acyltransferase (E2) component